MVLSEEPEARRPSGSAHSAATELQCPPSRRAVSTQRELAERGLLVRHLALPNGLAGTEAALRFLAEEISSDTYLNVMGQYRPCYRADEHPGLERPISGGEFSEALAIARRCGLHRLEHGSGRL